MLIALQGAVSQGVLWGIMVLGVFITFRLLDIPDMTCDGSFALGGCVCAVLIVNNNVDPLFAVLAGMCAGAIAGAVTGILTTVFEIPAILAGILTQISLWSINLRIMGKSNTPILAKGTIFSSVSNMTGLPQSTVAIILGILLGGQLIGSAVSAQLLALDIPLINIGIDSAPEAAIGVIIFVYLLAAWFNTRIPHTGVEMRPLRANPQQSHIRNLAGLLPDFWQCNKRLWNDRLGQISLATTTLFWGAGGNLKYTAQASSLTGVVAIGTAVGAVVASMRMRLDMATKVIPLGIAMGLLIILMNFIGNLWVAIPFLILLGGLGGFLVVPMNALLQHRGHNLMGAGRSIAVQNFNEQACILGLGAFYSICTGMGLSAYTAISIFGLLVAGFMWIIQRWHAHNCIHHKDEVEHLLDIARHDNHH